MFGIYLESMVELYDVWQVELSVIEKAADCLRILTTFCFHLLESDCWIVWCIAGRDVSHRESSGLFADLDNRQRSQQSSFADKRFGPALPCAPYGKFPRPGNLLNTLRSIATPLPWLSPATCRNKLQLSVFVLHLNLYTAISQSSMLRV